MSVCYPIIIFNGFVCFSTRMDLRNGNQATNITVDELYRPYGMVIPDGRQGLNVIDYIEAGSLTGNGRTFMNRAIVIDHRGEIRDITVAKLTDTKGSYELITPVSTAALTIIGGDDQQAAQCNVLMQLSDNPMAVLTHVAKMANDNNPCFVRLPITEVSARLYANGDTKSFYDYFVITRKRNELIREHMDDNSTESVKELVSFILDI